MAACDSLVFDSARRVIARQQRALAAGDFARARERASRAFRARVPLAQFESIVTTDYGFLLDDPAFSFAACVGQGSVAFVSVEVAADPAVLMVYRLVEERGGWFIDSAGVAGARGDLAA